MKKLSAKEVVAKAEAKPKTTKAKRTGTARPGNGGARAGAGRKPKAEKYKTAIQAAEAQIRDRLPELIDRLFRLTKSDSDRVALAAAQYLVDRVLGRPLAKIEQENEHSGGLKIVVEYTDTGGEE